GGTRNCSMRWSARPANAPCSARNPWRALISGMAPLAVPCPSESVGSPLILVALPAGPLQITLWITGGNRNGCDATCSQPRSGQKKTGASRRPFASQSRSGLRRFWLHDHLDRGLDVGVQVHDDLELADVAQRAFA